jgi:hypothetical protein
MMRRRRYCNRLPGKARSLPVLPSIPAFIDTALTGPRARLSPSETVRRMAEDMREAAYREGGVSEADLLGRGYTAAQIKLHVEAARARAQELAGASL